jgi:Ca2+/Na+ antiporter
LEDVACFQKTLFVPALLLLLLLLLVWWWLFPFLLVLVLVLLLLLVLWSCFHQNMLLQRVDKRIDRRLVELPQVPSDRTAAPFPSVLLFLMLLLVLLVLGSRMMVQTLGKRDQEALRGRGGHGGVCARCVLFVACCCCCWSLTKVEMGWGG